MCVSAKGSGRQKREQEMNMKQTNSHTRPNIRCNVKHSPHRNISKLQRTTTVHTHTHRTIITQNTSYGHGKMVSAIYIMYHFWDHSSVLKMQSNGMTLRQMWTASRPQPKSADDPCCWSHEDPVRPNTTENEHLWSKTLVFKCHFHISICILTY